MSQARDKRKKKQKAAQAAYLQRESKVDTYEFKATIKEGQQNEEGRYKLNIDNREILIEHKMFTFHVQATTPEAATNTALKRVNPEQLENYVVEKLKMA